VLIAASTPAAAGAQQYELRKDLSAGLRRLWRLEIRTPGCHIGEAPGVSVVTPATRERDR
jgi:hypothetical protein